jgi:ribosome-associated translation inhibitor RaiA
MDLQVRILPTDLAVALRSHVERRVRLRLGRCAGRIGRVSVRVKDMATADGGTGKACGISVRLSQSGRTIRRETVDADLYVAIEYATERIGAAVERELESLRSSAQVG